MKLNSRLNGRSLFISVDGHVGYGPRIIQPGDLICVLLGLRLPCLLRKANGGRFQFLGTCFLDDIMRGEALDGGLNRQQLFEII